MTTQARRSITQDEVRCVVSARPTCELVASDTTPHELLSAALAASATLRLAKFVRRTKLSVQNMKIEVSHETGQAGLVLVLAILVQGRLTEDQLQKLLRVANRCAMRRALTRRISIIQLDRLDRS